MRTVFEKTLATASNTNISTLSSGSTSVALIMNGTKVPTFTTTAATASGSIVTIGGLPNTVLPGALIYDTSAASIAAGTTIANVNGSQTVILSAPVTGAVGNGDTIAIGPATIDTTTSTNTQLGRRVYVHSTGNDSGLTWTVVGTNASGAAITDSFSGVSGGDAVSNMDFLTVTSITPSTATASTVSAGTGAIGSTPWITCNWRGNSTFNLGIDVEIVSGSATYSVEYTQDDPNQLLAGVLFPRAITMTQFNNLTASASGNWTTVVIAVRLTIITGTGTVRMRLTEGGIG